MKATTVSRAADKFVVRMPDGMRERFLDYSNVKHVSMNTAIVQGLDSFLDGHAELQALLVRISEHRDRPFRLIVTGHFANA